MYTPSITIDLCKVNATHTDHYYLTFDSCMHYDSLPHTWHLLVDLSTQREMPEGSTPHSLKKRPRSSEWCGRHGKMGEVDTCSRCLVQTMHETGDKSETVSMHAHTHTHLTTLMCLRIILSSKTTACGNQRGRHCCRRHVNSGCSCRLMHLEHMHASCALL